MCVSVYFFMSTQCLQSPEEDGELQAVVSCLTGVLGTELQSSGRTVLNYWATFLALVFHCLCCSFVLFLRFWSRIWRHIIHTKMLSFEDLRFCFVVFFFCFVLPIRFLANKFTDFFLFVLCIWRFSCDQNFLSPRIHPDLLPVYNHFI